MSIELELGKVNVKAEALELAVFFLPGRESSVTAFSTQMTSNKNSDLMTFSLFLTKTHEI